MKEKIKDSPNHILGNTVFSNSTMKSWTKDQLIEHIRILEHNWKASLERSEAQSQYINSLMEQLDNLKDKIGNGKLIENPFVFKICKVGILKEGKLGTIEEWCGIKIEFNEKEVSNCIISRRPTEKEVIKSLNE